MSDVDFLLGVSDHTREGALRFRAADDGPFLDPSAAVPLLIELPRLLHASDAVARDAGAHDAIKALLDAGSGSLGGARPKASVADGGRLHIAKFPHPSDEWDVMAWEKTALDLAERAGIRTPARRLTVVDGRSVLLLERFDRRDGRRVGYVSAMTMLGAQDGDVLDYAELAEALPEYSSRATADLRELWRRIVVSVAIHNTDDHMRNLGFLRDRSGWSLAPVFDINPNPALGSTRVTSIGGGRSVSDEIDGLVATAPTFRVSTGDSSAIIREVVVAVSLWREVAAANGIARREREQFAPSIEDRLRHLADAAR